MLVLVLVLVLVIVLVPSDRYTQASGLVAYLEARGLVDLDFFLFRQFSGEVLLVNNNVPGRAQARSLRKK